MQKRQSHWNQLYQEKDAAQLGWTQAEPQPSFDWVMEGPTGEGVLDIGAGVSRLVDRLVSCGVQDLTILDWSAAAVQAVGAREGLGEVARIVADVTTWEPSRTYGVWHDRAVFHFLETEAERMAYRGRMNAAVNIGGRVVMGCFAATGPERCSGLPVRRATVEGLVAFMGANWSLVDARNVEHTTPGGRKQDYIFVHFVRIAM